jgi:unsaturated chondroitin disaccharide hydrolase
VFSAEIRQWAKGIVQKCEDKYRWVSEKHAGGIPYTTGGDGSYDNRADAGKAWRADDGLHWWTNGFWGGILWRLYGSTGEKRFADIAQVSERLLDQCFSDFYGLHHDVGFMWLPTSVANYRLTGNADSRRRALHAASLLAGRFNPVGGFIRAWNDLEGLDTRGWAIIDCMLNLPLLYWASDETGDPRFRQIATAHAETVMRTFLRADGSAHHIVEFDPETGKLLATHGGQGYKEGSAWTRGQAWALYGFAISYAATGKEAYRAAAERVADYFASHIPSSGLIPIDFDQPAEPPLEDSCAAAIAACGFLALAQRAKGEKSERYTGAALKLLKALDLRRSDYSKACDAILTHCSGAYHSPASHHITMVYADYFYMSALYRILGDMPGFCW